MWGQGGLEEWTEAISLSFVWPRFAALVLAMFTHYVTKIKLYGFSREVLFLGRFDPMANGTKISCSMVFTGVNYCYLIYSHVHPFLIKVRPWIIYQWGWTVSLDQLPLGIPLIEWQTWNHQEGWSFWYVWILWYLSSVYLCCYSKEYEIGEWWSSCI